jgi:hypothetical protein
MKLRHLFAFCALAGLCWGGGWRSKRFPDWSDAVVRKALTDSPWTHRRSVGLTWHEREEKPLTPQDVPGNDPKATTPMSRSGGSPVGGIGVARKRNSLPLTADLLVRWSSALPIRHARALYRLRDEHLPETRLNGLIEQPGEDYIVEIFGLPSEMAHLGAGMLEEVARQGVKLKSGGREHLSNRARVVLNGDTLAVFVHFPRSEELRAEDREVTVYVNLQVVKFDESFKLGEMNYLDRLEL